MMSPKLWHWEYFQTRPLSSPTEKDYYGNRPPFRNSWCRACISACVEAMAQKDTEDLARGVISDVRSPDELLLQAFSTVPPIPGRREAFEPHIRNCKLVSPTAKAQLALEHPHSTSHSSPWPLGSTTGTTGTGTSNSQALAHSTPSSTHYAPSTEQAAFETDLCKLWVANGWAWYMADNPETRKFFSKWFPTVTLPDSQELSGPILRRLLDATYAYIRGAISGRLATVMSHGWGSPDRDSLVTSLLSVDYTTYTTKVHNVLVDHKMVDDYLALVLRDIDCAEKEFNTQVIAWVSDPSADSRAMRTRLQILRPHILAFDSWDEQINLVVGNILSRNTQLVNFADAAVDLIEWILQCPRVLDHLRQEQVQTDEKPRTLVLPASARWTSYLFSVQSLRSASERLRSLAARDTEAFRPSSSLIRDPKQEENLLSLLASSRFWDQLAEFERYLEPLAIAANISKYSSTRLDHVLVELGRLYQVFSNPDWPTEIREPALASLERRWVKMDQDPLILAVFFNPDIRGRFFNKDNTLLNPNALYKAAQRVFSRVFRKEPDVELYGALLDYSNFREEFHPDRWFIEDCRGSYEQKGEPLNLVELWRGQLGYQTPNEGRFQLTHLAMHIFSIVANSAGSEQFPIHARRRSQRDLDAAVVRAGLKRKRSEEQSRSRAKRQYGASPLESVMSAVRAGGLEEDILDVSWINGDSVPSMRSLAAKLYQDILNDEDEALKGKGTVEVLTQTSASDFEFQPGKAKEPCSTQVPIPLRDLFDYTSEHEAEGDGLNIFKPRGMANLQAEFERHALATRHMLMDLESNDATN